MCLPQSRWLPSRACRHSTAVTSPRARRDSHSSTTRSGRARDLEQRALEQRLLLADAIGELARPLRDRGPGCPGSGSCRAGARRAARSELAQQRPGAALRRGATARLGPALARRGALSGSKPPISALLPGQRRVSIRHGLVSSLGREAWTPGARAAFPEFAAAGRRRARAPRAESRAAPRRWRSRRPSRYPFAAMTDVPKGDAHDCSSRRTTSRAATSARTSATSPRCSPRSGSARSTS